MTKLDRIHCDRIIFCTHNQIKNKINKVVPLQAKIPFVLNYRRDPDDERDFRFTTNFLNVLDENDTMPVKVDHSSKMSSVKDQGYLGSCVGFAVTAMKEFQEQKEHDEEVSAGKRDVRKGRAYDLSESWLYWKSKEIDAWPNEEGTSIRYAMKILKTVGVPTENAWPYNDIDYGKPKRWAKLVAKWALIDSYWRVYNLNDLKTALLDGPVPIGVPCFYEFFYPRNDGIISDPANPNQMYGGHAVCAVGFDDEKGLIKFKNSWGKNWGEDGYGYLSYNYIDNYLWDAWACKDVSVTKDMLKG